MSNRFLKLIASIQMLLGLRYLAAPQGLLARMGHSAAPPGLVATLGGTVPLSLSAFPMVNALWIGAACWWLGGQGRASRSTPVLA